ncbi:MAG: hypothetical protein ACREEM_03005 [Blastocatellia bacterium]
MTIGLARRRPSRVPSLTNVLKLREELRDPRAAEARRQLAQWRN